MLAAQVVDVVVLATEATSAAGDSDTGLLVIAALGAVAFVVGRVTRQFLSEVIVFLAIGILIGPAVLGADAIINTARLSALEPVTALALGAIVFGIGERLEVPKLALIRHSLFPIAILENVLTFGLVFGAMLLVGLEGAVAYLLAAIAISTSPLTLVAVVNERRAAGNFTDHLSSTTALNNVTSALLFGIGLPVVLAGGSTTQGVQAFVQLVVIAPAVGLVGGWVLRRFGRTVDHTGERLLFVLIVLLGMVATAQALGAPVVLATLVGGAYFANDKSDTGPIFAALRTLDAPIFLVFFVVAGAQVHFDELVTIGGFGLAFVVARLVGKLAGGWGGANSTRSGRRWAWGPNVGLGLLPFAGMAIGLAAFTVEKANAAGVPELGGQVSAITLGAVVVFELLGPLTVGRALDSVGDSGSGSVAGDGSEALVTPHTIHHLLFPVSSPEMARQKAPFVLDLAAATGATVTAVHIVTPGQLDPDVADPTLSAIRQLAAARGVQVETLSREAEDVVAALVDIAESGAIDLIVVGETPPRLLDRGGQKFAHVLAERAGCHVIVIPTLLPRPVSAVAVEAVEPTL